MHARPCYLRCALLVLRRGGGGGVREPDSELGMQGAGWRGRRWLMLHDPIASEYLRRPAPRTRYASQLGHMCRILEIQHNVETILGASLLSPLGNGALT